MAGNEIDLIFTSMAYHHFRDAARVAHDCRRVCRQGAVAEYAEKLTAGGDSILASIEPRELHSGIEAIRRHAARVDPIPVTEPIDILVFRAH